ncbi:hypothetical protein B0T17DRAFT_494051 [Bombardia bombarda]|uniref:Uncharacterized protein n=1 Tax=Bombardia bombarda TaxID=252184 RepID=A0AA39WUY2_9PEZI|nr:hypothetical protein B0T17DRAFT_494051 [Bombardia bombarda]
MHFSTLLTAISALTFASAAAVDTRLGAFDVSVIRGRPLSLNNTQTYEFALGQDNNSCLTFGNSTNMNTVDVKFWNPQCLLTLFEERNCSDLSVVTGPNCWTPDGGIAAFKVTCPYRN